MYVGMGIDRFCIYTDLVHIHYVDGLNLKLKNVYAATYICTIRTTQLPGNVA